MAYDQYTPTDITPYSAPQTTENPGRGGQTTSNPSRGGQTTPGTSSSFSSPSGGNSGGYSSNTVGSNSGSGRTNSGGYSGGDATDSMVGSSGGDLLSGTTARPAQTRDEVRTAQSYLGALGLYNGKFDGLNGPKTRAATLSFQQQWNKDHQDDPIQEDGILGWEPTGPIGSVQPGQAETRPRLEAAGQAALANRSSYTASSPAGSYVPPAPPAPPPAAVVAATSPVAPVSQLAAAVPPNPTPRPVSPLEALRASPDGGSQTQGALGHEDAIKAIIAPYVGGSFGNRPVGSYGNGAAPPAAAAPAAPPAAAEAPFADPRGGRGMWPVAGGMGQRLSAPISPNAASLAAARTPAAASLPSAMEQAAAAKGAAASGITTPGLMSQRFAGGRFTGGATQEAGDLGTPRADPGAKGNAFDPSMAAVVPPPASSEPIQIDTKVTDITPAGSTDPAIGRTDVGHPPPSRPATDQASEAANRPPEGGGVTGWVDRNVRYPLGIYMTPEQNAVHRKTFAGEGAPPVTRGGPTSAEAAPSPTRSLETAKVGGPAMGVPSAPAGQASPADRVMNILGLSARTDTPVQPPSGAPESDYRKPPDNPVQYNAEPGSVPASGPLPRERPEAGAPGVQGSAAPDTKQQVLDQIAQAPPERRQAAAEHAMVLGAAAHQMIGASPEQQGKILDGLVADGTLDKAKADEMRRNPPSEADLTQVFEAGIAVHDLYAGGESALSGAKAGQEAMLTPRPSAAPNRIPGDRGMERQPPAVAPLPGVAPAPDARGVQVAGAGGIPSGDQFTAPLPEPGPGASWYRYGGQRDLVGPPEAGAKAFPYRLDNQNAPPAPDPNNADRYPGPVVSLQRAKGVQVASADGGAVPAGEVAPEPINAGYARNERVPFVPGVSKPWNRPFVEKPGVGQDPRTYQETYPAEFYDQEHYTGDHARGVPATNPREVPAFQYAKGRRRYG